MREFFDVLWSIIFETAPYVLIGMLAAGFVSEGLSKFRQLHRFVSRKSFLSLSFFNLFGFAMPICSCGTIPMAVGFRNGGVPFGNIYSFIFTAPATSIAAVIFAAAMLGPKFTLYYVGGAVICGYAIGFFFYLLDLLPTWRSLKLGSPAVCYKDNIIKNKDNFITRSLKQGFLVYGSEIAFDMIIGLSLTSLLVSTYSLQTLTGWFENLSYYQAAFLMMVLALPMYVCSLPGILMGATLILSGLKPELLWVFLMSGPITNLGDMNVLRRQVGFKTTITYMAAVVSVTLLWGWVIKAGMDHMKLWMHVRQYFREFPAVIAGTLAVNESPPPRQGGDLWGLIHYICAFLFIALIVYGTHAKFDRIWRNPCLHCSHYQRNINLTVTTCKIPCWKRRLIVFFISRKTI